MARRANTSPCSHVQLEWLALKSWPEDRSVIHPPSPNYVEGRNVHIEIRFAAAESFKSLAEELVAAQPDVFLAQTTPADPPKRGRRTASNARLLGRFKVGHGLTGGQTRIQQRPGWPRHSGNSKRGGAQGCLLLRFKGA
jgi:hypothetical protein